MVKVPKIKLIQGFGCPEGCRKKFLKVRDVNDHLTRVHQANYKIFIHNGVCYIQLKRHSIILVPAIRVSKRKTD